MEVYRVGVVILITICITNGEDRSSETSPYFEYTQIFRNVPILFEYLIATLQDRPEILEKSDIKMFEENIQLHASKTENGDTENNKKKRNAVTDHEFIDSGTKVIKNDNKNKISDIKANSLTNNVENTDGVLHGVSSSNQKTDFENVYKTDNVQDEKLSQGFGEQFLGFDNLFALDVKPEEIEERIILIDKLLEDYNNKKTKKNEC